MSRVKFESTVRLEGERGRTLGGFGLGRAARPRPKPPSVLPRSPSKRTVLSNLTRDIVPSYYSDNDGIINHNKESKSNECPGRPSDVRTPTGAAHSGDRASAEYHRRRRPRRARAARRSR